MPKTVILGAARTPFGKMGGGLASLDATDLGGTAIAAALERAEVAPEQVEHVVFGQVLQAGQGQIPSRQAQIKAGIPKEVSSRDRQQGLRLGPALGGHGRPGGARRRPRRGGGRRHGVDVERPLPAPAGPLRLPHGRRQGARRDGARRAHQPVQRQGHGRGGRRGGRRARDHPRGHGQVRAALARAGRPGHRRGPAAGGDRAGDRVSSQKGDTHGRGGRGAAARVLARGARPSCAAPSTRTARTPPATRPG